MNDEMDVYLNRYLKNWAVQLRPPADGREQLMQKAAAPPAEQEMSYLHALLNKLLSRSTSYHPHCGYLFGPFTQSRAWSFHIAATLRQVA